MIATGSNTTRLPITLFDSLHTQEDGNKKPIAYRHKKSGEVKKKQSLVELENLGTLYGSRQKFRFCFCVKKVYGQISFQNNVDQTERAIHKYHARRTS